MTFFISILDIVIKANHLEIPANCFYNERSIQNSFRLEKTLQFHSVFDPFFNQKRSSDDCGSLFWSPIRNPLFDLFFSPDESHRGNQELLSGCDRGTCNRRCALFVYNILACVSIKIALLCSALLPVLREYAHVPVRFGVEPHGCQQLRVSLQLGRCFADPCTSPTRTQLVSFCPCRLAGGLPPYASVCPTWVDCWRHLSREVNAWHPDTCPHMWDADVSCPQ